MATATGALGPLRVNAWAARAGGISWLRIRVRWTARRRGRASSRTTRPWPVSRATRCAPAARARLTRLVPAATSAWATAWPRIAAWQAVRTGCTRTRRGRARAVRRRARPVRTRRDVSAARLERICTGISVWPAAPPGSGRTRVRCAVSRARGIARPASGRARMSVSAATARSAS